MKARATYKEDPDCLSIWMGTLLVLAGVVKIASLLPKSGAGAFLLISFGVVVLAFAYTYFQLRDLFAVEIFSRYAWIFGKSRRKATFITFLLCVPLTLEDAANQAKRGSIMLFVMGAAIFGFGIYTIWVQ